METLSASTLSRPIQRALIRRVLCYLIPLGIFVALTGLLTNIMTSFHLSRVLVNLLVLASFLISALFLRRGSIDWGFRSLLFGLLIAFSLSTLGIAGIVSPNYFGFMLVIVTVSVISSSTKLLLWSYIAFVLTGALSFLPALKLYDPPKPLSPFRIWTIEIFYGLSITVILYFARRARASMLHEISHREAQLSSIFSSISEPLIVSDLKGARVEMNSSAERLNQALLEQTGLGLLELQLIEIQSNQPVTLRSLITQAGTKARHLQVKRGGEQPAWYSVSISLQHQEGTPSGVVLFLKDLTDQYHFMQAQKMSAVGVLANGIAHDFNNMLGAIQNASELLSLELEEEEQLEMVEIIREATLRSSALVSQLRQFSKTTPVSQTWISTETLIQHVYLQLQSVATQDQRVNLELDVRESVLKGDLTQLQTALVNLGLNALQALPGPGQIYLRAYRQSLDEATCQRGVFNPQPGEFLCVEVQDHGEGIKPEVRDQIFEPFFTTKGVGKGAGLGLSTVFGAAQAHQGLIEVESEVGKGSTFRLYLPLAQQPEPIERSDADQGPYKINIERVLVIDDEPLIRRSLTGMLESLKIEVNAVESGEAGLNMLREDAKFDLIILDMQMPNQSGREVFYALQERCPDIPVVISSGFSPEGVIEELMSRGLVGLLSKPYRMEELQQTLALVSDLKQEA